MNKFGKTFLAAGVIFSGSKEKESAWKKRWGLPEEKIFSRFVWIWVKIFEIKIALPEMINPV
jgi:hypothetical protein